MPASGRSRFCVYRLVNSANGLPFYVGATQDPRDRMKAHRKGNLATPEGRARDAVVAALTAAWLSMTMEIYRTFPYRGCEQRSCSRRKNSRLMQTWIGLMSARSSERSAIRRCLCSASWGLCWTWISETCWTRRKTHLPWFESEPNGSSAKFDYTGWCNSQRRGHPWGWRETIRRSLGVGAG